MKKLALVFVLAIFAPALLLGVLALRTAGRQRIIMQQQEVELRQQQTDALAEKVRALLAGQQSLFLATVDRIRARVGVQQLGTEFSTDLPAEWGRDCVGFAVDENGVVLSPSPRATSDSATRDFLRQNAAFLANQAPAEVYQTLAKSSQSAATRGMNGTLGSAATKSVPPDLPLGTSLKDLSSGGAASTHAFAADATAAIGKLDEDSISAAAQSQKLRAVVPQFQQAPVADAAPPVSQLYYATSRFRQLVANGNDGVLARFVEDELVVIFWVRPAGLPRLILGVQIKASDLFNAIRPGIDPPASRDACLAILDDRAQPVLLSTPGFSAAWKNPFVATEVGETLPHWEAALYLLNPDAVSQSAHLITLTLYGLVGLAIGAIAWGSLLIATDTRRQLSLAQKKTDFVSNVSHELKTPLTSIRMFAELLHERRVTDPAKVTDYLRIIRLEAERLTRLINNVLDFARLERNQKHYNRRFLDLHPEIEHLWQAQSEHLRAQGFQTASEIAPGPMWAHADPDAIVQVIVNLLSNAEKYSLEKKEIELRASVDEGEIRISIFDRGAGIPAGEEKKIFESFYRAHDSLSSGIPGSGLGLTLARRIARDLGGDIRCEPRPGGGTTFTLAIPSHQPPQPT